MPTEITRTWDHKYDTNPNAEALEHRYVEDVLAVRVMKAKLRTSELSGVFEVAVVERPFDVHAGNLRVEVKVGWFGMRPEGSWAHLTLGKDWSLIPNYSGDVVHNLGVK